MSLNIKRSLYQLHSQIHMLVLKRYPLLLDYTPVPGQRYGYGKAPHTRLYEIINNNRASYAHLLSEFLNNTAQFHNISKDDPGIDGEPFWINGWFSSLDAIALYSFLCMNKPATYLEIGSGSSTKFARRSISDNNLNTKLISIDPHPRAEIDAICDKIIRQPLESTDIDIFKNLEANDILFMDGSHRCFTNSDVTVFFLEILPALKPGVLCHIHDIFLPYDYPPEWHDRYYSEQYMLAVCLLAGTEQFDIVLPNAFITYDTQLQSILLPLAEYMNPQFASNSFWIRVKKSYTE